MTMGFSKQKTWRFLKRFNLFVWLGFYGLLTLGFFWLFTNLSPHIFRPPDKERIQREIIWEYNYLKSLLDQPDTKPKTTTDGYSNFTSSEWPFMTLSLFCYGARNLAVKGVLPKEEVSRYMKKAIERAKSPNYYHFIVEHYGDPFSTDRIRDNAFYLGHFTVMLAMYREVSADKTYDELLHRFCRAFYENFRQSPTYSVESYPGQCWSSEQAVPLRALKIHDDIFGTNYGEVISRWRRKMEERFIDPNSQLLVSAYDKKSGVILEGPRTIANAWTILFLHDVLPDFCADLYRHMKKSFLIKRFGFPVFKEYLGQEQYSTPDTGPIVWGISAPSTCFAMGCAGIYGDGELFSPLNVLADGFGLPMTGAGKRRYVVGGQIGTACVFLCRSLSLLGNPPPGPIPAKGLSLLCLVIAVIVFLLSWRIWRLVKQLLRSP